MLRVLGPLWVFGPFTATAVLLPLPAFLGPRPLRELPPFPAFLCPSPETPPSLHPRPSAVQPEKRRRGAGVVVRRNENAIQ